MTVTRPPVFRISRRTPWGQGWTDREEKRFTYEANTSFLSPFEKFIDLASAEVSDPSDEAVFPDGTFLEEWLEENLTGRAYVDIAYYEDGRCLADEGPRPKLTNTMAKYWDDKIAYMMGQRKSEMICLAVIKFSRTVDAVKFKLTFG